MDLCGQVCPANTSLKCTQREGHTHTPFRYHAQAVNASSPLKGRYTNEYRWHDRTPDLYERWEQTNHGYYDWTIKNKEPVVEAKLAPPEIVEITDWDLLPDPMPGMSLLTWEEHLKNR